MVNKVKVYNRLNVRSRKKAPGTQFDPEKGLTRQEFKDDCNINTIMKRFLTSGVPPIVDTSPAYGTPVPYDLREASQLLVEAQRSFEQVPADIRKQFDNDPLAFVEYVQDPENKEQLYDWGLAVRPTPEEPALVRVVNEPTPSDHPSN